MHQIQNKFGIKLELNQGGESTGVTNPTAH